MPRPTLILALVCALIAGVGHVTAQEPQPGDPATDPTAPLETTTTETTPEPATDPDRETERDAAPRARSRDTRDGDAPARGDAAADDDDEADDGERTAAARERAKRRAAKRRRERRAERRLVRRIAAPGTTFPIYGAAGFDDTFGAARQIGEHQGNDLFADFGAPVLAVADGVVEKVGTLPISGNRLWLRTPAGDEFFYAHLSAFSPQAQNGRRVAAGTVLGFVGTTGDAETTAPHVHFEIHPGGGDAVDPFAVLRAWDAMDPLPATAWLRRHGTDTDARPGALLPRRDYLGSAG